MSKSKRMRVFAGPNGSGKTTIILDLKTKYSFGVYVNADDIEATLREYRKLDLRWYQVTTNTSRVQDFFRQSTFAPVKLAIPDLWTFFYVEGDYLSINDELEVNSYIAADVAELLRQILLQEGLSFTYETVMSHTGKLAFMAQAREHGYRVYLYYIATNDPDININRVDIRLAQKGHGVSPEVIRSRYYKSLENLKEAVIHTDRAFLFDNSGEKSKLLAEVTNGKEVTLEVDAAQLPNWFFDYLVQNKHT
jgi:predicted ABC-type ATPase